MHIEAVLFDLFDTLLLIEGSEDDDNESFYKPSLRKLHEVLVRNRVGVSLEEFSRAYFDVRNRFYAETRQSLEEPHMTVRLAQTMCSLGYRFDASDRVIVAASEAFAEEFMRYVRLDQDAHDVLQRLQGKYKLGIVSNAFVPETVWKLLERYELRRFFDVVMISGEINRRKPHAEIFERALEAIGVPAFDAVFVGDMVSLDVVGAKNVGMKAILIERRPTDEAANAKPDYTIKRLKELPMVLEDC